MRPLLLDTPSAASRVVFQHSFSSETAMQPASEQQHPSQRYTSMKRAAHSLHECTSADDFQQLFESSTRLTLKELVWRVVIPSAPQAVFVVGSLAQGMAASGSDVDLIALIDSKDYLSTNTRTVNNTRELQFASEADPLLAGIYLTMHEGILIDLQVAISPAIRSVYKRLRQRGPELNETEVQTLGRISTGWLLWETDDYLERNGIRLKEPTLEVYCCTKQFVSALHQQSKAERALQCNDVPLALQHGRAGVEYAYLAFLASDGHPHLGSKWLAQLGHARGAAERMRQSPLLEQGLRLLFPAYPSTPSEAAAYVAAVSEYLKSMRELIERKTLFRIAFNACPQISE